MSLGKRLPSAASFSPASGMWGATYTSPATDGSVPASVMTAPSIAVGNENTRPILQSQNAFGGRDIVLGRCLWLLNKTDIEAVFDEDAVDALPARTVSPSPMHQHDIPNAMRIGLGCEGVAGGHHQHDREESQTSPCEHTAPGGVNPSVILPVCRFGKYHHFHWRLHNELDKRKLLLI
jgi:hypothetical protein